MNNEWAPRVGVVWDFIGDGTSKLYASAGRFYFSLPTDLNVRVFTANSAVTSYNYVPDNTTSFRTSQCTAGVTSGCVPRNLLFQGGSASGEPVDGWTDGEEWDPGRQGFLPGRADHRRREGPRSDPVGRPEGHVPDARPHGRRPLRPRRRRVAPSSCALFNPGGDGQAASGFFPTCNGSQNPTDPTAGRVLRDRRAGGRCQAHLPRHRAHRAQAVLHRALDADVLPVLVVEGQLLRRHPRGLRPDGPRHQRRLRLLPVHVQRLRQPRARPAGPGPHRRGLQRAVRSLDGRSGSTSARVSRSRGTASSTTSIRTCCTSTRAERTRVAFSSTTGPQRTTT